MSTPTNPISKAVQRADPARSLSHSTDSSADHNGAEKLMAMAPASGIMLTARTVKVCEIDCERPRTRWSRGRLVANTENPTNGSTKAAQTTSEENERKNITSPTGYTAAISFANAAVPANNTVAAIMKAIPIRMLSTRSPGAPAGPDPSAASVSWAAGWLIGDLVPRVTISIRPHDPDARRRRH